MYSKNPPSKKMALNCTLRALVLINDIFGIKDIKYSHTVLIFVM